MSRFRLVSLRVEGFRGFPERAGTIDFHFDERCTFLFGEQGSAKSSAVHAIEWCLFGDKIALLTDTGIQQRRGWQIRNKQSAEAKVEVTLQRDGDILRVRRYDCSARDRRQFSYQLNRGQPLQDEQALRVMLGIELRDYLSSVHLHQEVVDALLVEEPAKRKNALDRLMGIAELRNLFDGFKKADVDKKLKEIDRQFSQLEQQATASMSVKKADLARMESEVKASGIGANELSFPGVKLRCEALVTGLGTFAAECGLATPNLPPFGTLDALHPFLAATRETIRKLRTEQPTLKRQTELLGRRGNLNRLKADYEARKNSLNEAQAQIQQLVQAHGDLGVAGDKFKKIETELLPNARNRRDAVNNRAGIISETLKLLAATKPEDIEECPVCERAGFAALQVRERLTAWQGEMRQSMAPIEEEILKLEVERTGLSEAIRQISLAQSQIEPRRKELQAAAGAIGAALHREISSDEDASSLVNDEAAKIERDLENLRRAVEQSNQRLDAMDDGLEGVKRIVAVLRLKVEINELSEIKETPEYKEVEAARSRAHGFGDQVRTIRGAVETVLQRTADQKVKATKQAICSFYRELAARADYPDIEIDAGKYEVLAVREHDSQAALSILNKGDLNCAALSIFLALATSKDLAHNLGFIVLDDPSQSLDAPHKERLTGLLARVLAERQLIIATSESDFMAQLRNNLAGPKKVYSLRNWSEHTGPEIEAE
jgi:DNA repair exonuclease SbcCD ATPase subunit